MLSTEQTLSMSAGMRSPYRDAGMDESPSAASTSAMPIASDEAWQKLLDNLADWGRIAASVDEDGFQFPTREAIKKSFQWLKVLKNREDFLPQRVVAAGDGGIAIELLTGPELSETLDVDDSGQVEYLLFENCQLVRRSQLH